MPRYKAPVEDFSFILHDVLQVSAQSTAGYGDLTPDFTQAILSEAGKIADEVMGPSNAEGDAIGVKLENGEISTPPSFKQAFDQLRNGGWTSLNLPAKYGGQELPYIIYNSCLEMFDGANLSLMMYSMLTSGAIEAIEAHGSEELKQKYIPNMVSSQWTGTMNLTEPHSGTDLGLLRTKAEPQADGSYKISGQKIFITAGDHDLSENIIHLVLARLPDAPEGVGGISLFLVPKFFVDDAGAIGDRNSLSVGKIEEKMGIHGSSTCVMNYDEATGWLVGQEHKGLRAMFTMMNVARVGVGVQGLSQAHASYVNAVDYANDRIQGRSLTGAKFPEQAADPIIVHPDVRRMLMDQRSFVEGGRAFLLWSSQFADQHMKGGNEESGNLFALLTPILKAFLTDKGFESAVIGQQVYGGHGFIEEWGMSQFVRDARITQIYEGTNGVQALDLVGRKLPLAGGQTVQSLLGFFNAFIADNETSSIVEDFVKPFAAAVSDLEKAIGYMSTAGADNPDNPAAGSIDFLHLMGHTCLGYVWCLMAKASVEPAADAVASDEFRQNKLITGRYYMAKQLPSTKSLLEKVKAGASPVMALSADAF